MQLHPNPIPPRLFKVVTLSIRRAHHLIEAQSEAEALDMAQEMSLSDSMIDRRSVITLVNAHGGNCHV